MALPRKLAHFFLLSPLLTAASADAQQASPPSPPLSIFDSRLSELRKASVTWDVRCGPDRKVVDLVCLVPDTATFLEAVKVWDREHYFPILIDDAELNMKFIRAFHPAKVVRFPKKATPIAGKTLMDEAIAAVGYSWRESGSDRGLPGGRVPDLSPPPPPGVVVSQVESPSLPAAVALAAGRFQPLVAWEWSRSFFDALDEADAFRALKDLNALIGGVVPRYRDLGDDCDFITLAGQWPYRYRSEKVVKQGVVALDDLLGRDLDRQARRSAFVGRILGRTEQCVYQAMCSLFLTADSGTLFDTYEPNSPTWAGYEMTKARVSLSKALRVTVWPGYEGDGPAIWHKAFDPINKARFVMVNTHGGDTSFNLPTNGGRTADIPFSIPTAVHFLHSYSAANPVDQGTLAGRWLANGAFVYYGSLNEPYLTSFRTPELIANLLSFNLPLVAAFRKEQTEIFGTPWRLVFFGDPLYRLRRVRRLGARVAAWDAVDKWPVYPTTTAGPVPSAEDEKLAWALRIAIGSAADGRDKKTSSQLFTVLSKLQRTRLPEKLRPVLEALCVDVYLEANQLSALRSRLAVIPVKELDADIRRWRDTVMLMELEEAISAKDSIRAGVIWESLARSDTTAELKLGLIDRLTPFFVRSSRLIRWFERVKAASPVFEGTPHEAGFHKALKKLESQVAASRSP